MRAIRFTESNYSSTHTIAFYLRAQHNSIYSNWTICWKSMAKKEYIVAASTENLYAQALPPTNQKDEKEMKNDPTSPIITLWCFYFAGKKIYKTFSFIQAQPIIATPFRGTDEWAHSREREEKPRKIFSESMENVVCTEKCTQCCLMSWAFGEFGALASEGWALHRIIIN